MKHLMMYENDNQDLYDLMGDLASLGIGSKRAHFELFHSIVDGRYIKGAKTLMATIEFPELDTLKRKINLNDVANALITKSYKMVVVPEKNEFITMHKIEQNLKMQVSKILRTTYIQEKNDGEEIIKRVMKNMVGYFANVNHIELFIEGDLLLSKSRMINEDETFI